MSGTQRLRKMQAISVAAGKSCTFLSSAYTSDAEVCGFDCTFCKSASLYFQRLGLMAKWTNMASAAGNCLTHELETLDAGYVHRQSEFRHQHTWGCHWQRAVALARARDSV